MVFSSPIFLFAFLPIVFLLSLLSRSIKYKNAVLAAFSLVFYSFGQIEYVPILLASILINYTAGRLLARSSGYRKSVLVICAVFNLGILGVFKYADFIVTNLNAVSGGSLTLPGIVLPIGISFFTFQGLSYVIDVYRNPECSTGSIFKMFLYISFFPQLIAGPIVKYHDIADQIDKRSADIEDIAQGIYRLCIGLAKKVLISNALGLVADTVINGISSAQAGYSDFRLAWLGALCYMMQIYFDFSGYSDMAIGMGRMFGFRFNENFNHPYTACSIRDFWRKWHISLSSWFREYLYIPLGGNRKGKARTILNRMIVFLCTGIWHGANWTFIIWGVLHGLLSCAEELKIIPVEKLSRHRLGRLICRVYTLISVMLLFVLFRADSVADARAIICTMFSFGALAADSALLHTLVTPAAILTLCAAVFFSLDLHRLIASKVNSIGRISKCSTVRYCAALALYILSIMSLASGGYNPFIYFQF